MSHEELISQLHAIKAVKFGSFTLKSGIASPIYIDLRQIVSHPNVLRAVAEAMWRRISPLHPQLLCGVPYTALPIATVISVMHTVPMVMRRKEAKDYGTRQMIEGSFVPGSQCVVVEDLITSGMSIMETIAPLQEAGLQVSDAVVLIDRQQGGAANLQAKGVALHSVFTISELLDTLTARHEIDTMTAASVKQFLTANQVISS